MTAAIAEGLSEEAKAAFRGSTRTGLVARAKVRNEMIRHGLATSPYIDASLMDFTPLGLLVRAHLLGAGE